MPHGITTLFVSALTGEGIAALREHLDQICFTHHASNASLALNQRHIQSIHEALVALRRGAEQGARAGPELLALDLREALDALGRILGRVTPDDLLGRIFSSFCIGK